MVAKSLLGELSSFWTLSSSRFSISDGAKEKYATSDAEINADDKSKNKITNKLNSTSALNKCKSIPLKIDNKHLTGTSSKLD